MTLVSSDDDLDWEFAFDSRLGHPAGPPEEPMAKRSKKRCEQLPILHPDAAGIDVSASELFVAVSADRDPQPVRSFPTFTRDLNALADWLQQCGIRSVAMESTSVYWIPVYQILESRGLEVCLVNAQHVKNVPGRKTDVSDCQWLQYLHSVGLLRASFRPPGFICAIRSLWRHRSSLIQMAAEHVLHMQKALDQMNLQIHRVLNDITGVSGLRILDAILAGEREPLTLARLCHGGVKSSEDTIAKSLEGDYRPEHLFALRQSLAAFHYYQQLVVEADQEIQRQLGTLDTATTAEPTVPKRTKASAYQRRRYEPKTLISTSLEQRLLITEHAVIIVDAQNRSLSGVIEHPYHLPTHSPMIDDLRRPRLVKFAHFATVVEHVDAERPNKMRAPVVAPSVLALALVPGRNYFPRGRR
jgi:hypothetical protein